MSKRNSPCKCGSSKKYKKCCLPKEREQQRQKELATRYAYAKCPCGSNKKFKDCCLKKANETPETEVMVSKTGLKREV